ncbi:glycosyltransferase family 4 protein [Maribacter sp. 2307ULW6-5]|uniref:glycosyltransferase family 4 protein n=1 Tax=Maribacter sp. 2307ULW6-5 TaxID=3386275 RepID=UPI0039BC5FF1
MKRTILFGIPPKNHVNLAMDEVYGLRELGYDCETIGYTRNNDRLSVFNKLMGVLYNAFAIVGRLYKVRPHVLYLNSRFEKIGCTRDFITILIIRLLYWRRLKITIKTHGSDLYILTQKSFFLNRMVIPYLQKEVALWFFLSQVEKDEIAAVAPRFAKKVFVTCNIIDPRRSVASGQFREKYDLDKGRFTFFFAGRMIADKGIFNIVKAISRFASRDECLFLFAGDGEDFGALKEEIERLGIKEQVRLLGFVPENECDHFFANTNALVYPTCCDEGFAMALFKAVACGMPVITTKVRAAADHLTEPEHCLWVDGRSVDSILAAMEQLYRDKELREQMGKNNVLLGQKFSRKVVAQQMCNDFNTLFLEEDGITLRQV